MGFNCEIILSIFFIVCVDSTPSSPPHIHPAPSPSHPPRPETSSPSQSAASPPSPAQADSEKEVRTPAPTPPPPPPPASEPPFATSAPETTPPPSPSPPQGAAQSHQDHPEPVESSESDIIVDVQAMPEEVSFHCDTPPEHAQAAESCETAACVDDDDSVIESPSESPDDADVTDAPSTPEKPPVQDSTPPVEKVTPASAIPLDDISEALDNTQVRRTT